MKENEYFIAFYANDEKYTVEEVRVYQSNLIDDCYDIHYEDRCWITKAVDKHTFKRDFAYTEKEAKALLIDKLSHRRDYFKNLTTQYDDIIKSIANLQENVTNIV